MIQKKYNKRIFDEATEESIERYSHMRSNVLSPVGISSDDNVLVLDPDSISLVEWIKEQAGSVTIGMSPEYITNDGISTLMPEEIDKIELDNVNSTFNIIISLGTLVDTPVSLKKKLTPEGKLVYAFSEKDHIASFAKKLLSEAGFGDVITYRVSPDYMYTNEIYSEDYVGGGAGDYLLIAR